MKASPCACPAEAVRLVAFRGVSRDIRADVVDISFDGEGRTFRFRLPRASAAALTAALVDQGVVTLSQLESEAGSSASDVSKAFRLFEGQNT